MSAYIPTNLFGNPLDNNISFSDYIESLDSKYVNEKDDIIENLKIKQEAKDELDVVNKVYLKTQINDLDNKINNKINDLEKSIKLDLDKVNLKVQNIYIREVEKNKRNDYKKFLDNYKPKFWISAMFPYGLQNKNQKEFWMYQDLTGNPVLIVEHPMLKVDENHNVGFYFDGESRIVSNYYFKENFSFIILCRKDKNKPGRLITRKWGNNVIGFWGNATDFIWLNKQIIETHNINNNLEDNTLKLYSVVSDADNTILHFSDHRVNKKILEFNYKNKNVLPINFTNIVLGKPISMAKEIGQGFIYECICFDYVIKQKALDEIFIVFEKYYYT
jgi:uncharacterized alkaline shock family protein YloU